MLKVTTTGPSSVSDTSSKFTKVNVVLAVENRMANVQEGGELNN